MPTLTRQTSTITAKSVSARAATLAANETDPGARERLLDIAKEVHDGDLQFASSAIDIFEKRKKLNNVKEKQSAIIAKTKELVDEMIRWGEDFINRRTQIRGWYLEQNRQSLRWSLDGLLTEANQTAANRTAANRTEVNFAREYHKLMDNMESVGKDCAETKETVDTFKGERQRLETQLKKMVLVGRVRFPDWPDSSMGWLFED